MWLNDFSGRRTSARSPRTWACARPRRSARTSSSTRTRCAASSATPRVGPDDVVLEVGPGLGSLTLALLPAASRVVAVELDAALARRAAGDGRRPCPRPRGDRLEVVPGDALRMTELPGPPPTALVANLPYNVAVPVVLHLLERVPVPAARAGHGAGRGRRPAHGRPRRQGVRRAVGEDGLVREDDDARATSAARCSGRCRTSTPAWSPSPGATPRRASRARRCSR